MPRKKQILYCSRSPSGFENSLLSSLISTEETKKTDKSRTAASRLYILELSVSFEGLYYCILRILHNSILSDVVYNVRSGRIKSVM